MLKRFHFDGVVPASKSHFNRALVCASYGKDIELIGESTCDDVLKMQKALALLNTNDNAKTANYDCGSAGTVLRFLALRVSRIPGVHILQGTKRLLSRPQEELRDVFSQVGVQLEIREDSLIISGDGWRPKNNVIKVNRTKSSQFASAILLNSWGLVFPLRIEWPEIGVSEGYWQMSAQVVTDFGMKLKSDSHGVNIDANSKTLITKYEVESDVSSTFALAALAALDGEATFRRFPVHTLQPDRVFLDILSQMGLAVETTVNDVRIFQNKALKGIHRNLNDCPDLFPVLATLCAFAQGPSRLDGAPHLVFKESNRIQKTAELIRRMGAVATILPDGMEIHPPFELKIPAESFSYDTDHDHRLAFAASLLQLRNYPIQILHPEVVSKSFPEFWEILVNNTQNL